MSQFNPPNTVNAAIAQNVWGENFMPRYQTEAFNTGSFHGYREPCRVSILITANSAGLTNTAWPLIPDGNGNPTGFRYSQRTFSGIEVSTPDGQRLFDTYYNSSTPDTVLVFQLPQLITVDENGNDLPRGFNGLAFDGDDPDSYSPFNLYVPSIWINSRVAAQYAPQSVFAHEISHIVLREPMGFRFWQDNSTVFLHIQTHVGMDKLTWIPNPGVMGSVTADDINRQELLTADGHDECFDAKSSNYVRWEVAP